MKRIALIIVSLVLALPVGRGQSRPPNAASVQSRSGQFVVYGVEPGVYRPFVPKAATTPTLVQLEASFLTVSCERIKQALLSALGAKDGWSGKIYVVLHPFRGTDEEITVTSSRLSETWSYRVDLPDTVEPARLVRTLTQVLLVEMANRRAGGQSARLPPWLAEGMPQYLLAKSDLDLVLQPGQGTANSLPTRSVAREGRLADPSALARKRLLNHSPLTIEEFDRPPAAEEMTGDAGEIYRNSALLFVHELLQLKNGGACLYAMLPELPWDPDWRVGFLKAFSPHFKREVELEKWWALQSAYLAGRDPGRTWPRAESLAKLNEILRTPFEIRLGSNEPALHTDVPLQAIIKGWKMDRQSPVLREKINLLQNLKLRIAPELKPLVQQYIDVLAAYLNKMERTAPRQKPFFFGRRSFAAFEPNEISAPAGDDAVLRQAIAELDVLDERCAAWKVAPEKPPEGRNLTPTP